MYPSKFDYVRAQSVEEAVERTSSHSNAKILAGGHSLIPALKLRLAQPDLLVDLGRIAALKGISRHNGTVSVGALTTHAACAASDDLPKVWSEAAGLIGDPQVRNRGTVGGNIAHADPASDLPTVLIALGAQIHVQGTAGPRAIPADEFFVDLFTTSLEEGEIITRVEVPVESNQGSAYTKVFNPASRYAILGVAAQVAIAGGVCRQLRVAAGGSTPKAIRAHHVEAALQGQPLNDTTIQHAAAAIADDLGEEVIGDMYASAAYRRSIAAQITARALSAAAARAR